MLFRKGLFRRKKKVWEYYFTFVTELDGSLIYFNRYITLAKKINSSVILEEVVEEVKKNIEGLSNVNIVFYKFLRKSKVY